MTIPAATSDVAESIIMTPGPPLRAGLSEPMFPSQPEGNPSPITFNCSATSTSLRENRRIVTNILRMWSRWAAEILWYKPDLSSSASLQKMLRTLESPSPIFAYSQLIRRLNFTSPRLSVSDLALTTLSRCELLESLYLNKCEKLTSVSLETALNSWPNLLFIDLTGVFEVNNEAIISLAETSHKLKGINLNGCKSPGNPALIALSLNCPDLHRLKMGGSDLVTDVGISAVVRGCPLLSDLDVQGCSSVTDTAIRAVWTHSHNIQQVRLASCNALTDLAFPSTIEGDDQKDDSDDLWCFEERGRMFVVAPDPAVITEPPQSISKGNEVEMIDGQEDSVFPGLTLVELCPLVIHQRSRSLRFLDLSHCEQITDVAIEGIVAWAPKLSSLVLARCSLLTDQSVEAISKLGRSLHHLNLAHVDQITDESVKKLARSCNKLTHADFACKRPLSTLRVADMNGIDNGTMLVLQLVPI
ncbi:hypothetical protein MD484_g4686, partial [Candolleomyces efflorescens]